MKKSKYPIAIEVYAVSKMGESLFETRVVYSELEYNSFVKLHPNHYLKERKAKWKEYENISFIEKVWASFPEWVIVGVSAILGVLAKEGIQLSLGTIQKILKKH